MAAPKTRATSVGEVAHPSDSQAAVPSAMN